MNSSGTLHPPSSDPAPQHPGQKRQRFIRVISAIGLFIYVPLFLLVLLWPGLIAAGAKKLLINEVNERFEKVGGLATAMQSKAVALKDKFEVLAADQARDEEEIGKLTAFVDAHAERLIAAFVNERAEFNKATGKVNTSADPSASQLDASELSPDGEKDFDGDTTIIENELPADETVTTDGKSSKPWRTWASSAKTRLRGKLNGTTATESASTGTAIGATLLRFAAGADGLIERFVKVGGKELQNLKSAIYEKYDQTLQELVKEARIFTGSNILIFGLLWVASGSPRVARHVFPAAVVLLFVTLSLSFFYLVETNWVFNILYQSYFGWGYIAAVIILSVWILLWWSLERHSV